MRCRAVVESLQSGRGSIGHVSGSLALRRFPFDK